MLRIRPLVRDDFATWQSLFSSVADEGLWIGAEPPVGDRSGWLEEAFLDRDDNAMLIAEVDGTPVGWISVELDDAMVGELGMGIISGFRSQGIGTALTRAAIEWARMQRAPRLMLRVFPHNERAIGLYRKMGFVETEKRIGIWPRRNGDMWDVIFMELDLTA